MSGQQRLLLVSTRQSSSLHVLGPDFDHRGGSVKNVLKKPVAALVHTEHGSSVSGFKAGVLCIFKFFLYFQNI